jgi:hypothetical protein
MMILLVASLFWVLVRSGEMQTLPGQPSRRQYRLINALANTSSLRRIRLMAILYLKFFSAAETNQWPHLNIVLIQDVDHKNGTQSC